ncbi:zinc-ribbon and DUF3426 domain-containing protein [Nitrosomonas sp.]|uniref:zinc-ribbon and DUF3426 domain-containing protein n=1 Tax=Nitrosomonas sp. TaxID=42353 RepID=UPI0025F3F730|nr:zinc-ribbon and DUF3426 domain-containing protein [Nitrosomonas sp.]MCC6916053.1 zinc-ribbon and DUF3426 domain-containing protein [Nitrosomonas sp.]
MPLVTQCPGCHAVFRLTGIQLHTHNGEVRCGQCKQIFNGFAALITVPEMVIQPAAVSTSLEQPDSSAAALPAATSVFPADHFDTNPPAHKLSRWWLVSNTLLLVLLSGQFVHAYRTEIFIAFPALQSALNHYCNLMRCEINMPRHLHLLSLESSDLRVSSTTDPDVVTLTAIIRNHAPFPQELPALLLTLTDAEEKLLASRVFTAKDYLDSAVEQSVFAGGSEVQARCFLNTGGVNAEGYKLELIYP